MNEKLYLAVGLLLGIGLMGAFTVFLQAPTEKLGRISEVMSLDLTSDGYKEYYVLLLDSNQAVFTDIEPVANPLVDTQCAFQNGHGIRLSDC